MWHTHRCGKCNHLWSCNHETCEAILVGGDRVQVVCVNTPDVWTHDLSPVAVRRKHVEEKEDDF